MSCRSAYKNYSLNHDSTIQTVIQHLTSPRLVLYRSRLSFSPFPRKRFHSCAVLQWRALGKPAAYHSRHQPPDDNEIGGDE